MLQNPVSDYFIALATLAAGIVIANVLEVFIIRRLKRWVKKTQTTLDDELVLLFEKFLLPLAYVGVFYISIRDLVIHPILDKTIDVAGIILLTFFAIRLSVSLVEHSIRFYISAQQAANPSLEKSLHALRALIPASKVLIWLIGAVFLLENLGFDISAIVAGLGIGGVAVALASQGVLQDLFSYFAILFDRPFEIGDFITIDAFSGTVEYIGIKTTRLQSLDGEEIILANADVTKARIRNFKRMKQRRILLKFGVPYDVSLEQLTMIPDMIKGIIHAIDGVRFSHAHFLSYGNTSLNFEVVYYVITNDIHQHMNAQQQINLKLKQEFEQRNIKLMNAT